MELQERGSGSSVQLAASVDVKVRPARCNRSLRYGFGCHGDGAQPALRMPSNGEIADGSLMLSGVYTSHFMCSRETA